MAKNALLRLCNGLLGRIPNLTESALRFQVHLLLAQAIPLITDRSAVNLRGAYAGSTLNPAAFSHSFSRSAWTLHSYCQNPHAQLTEERKLIRLFEETQAFIKEIDEKRVEHIPQDLSLRHMIEDDLADTQRHDTEFLSLLLSQGFLYLSCVSLKDVKPALSDVDLVKLGKLKREISSALEKLAPKLMSCLELVIEREQKWVTWKERQCPQFEKTPLSQLPVEVAELPQSCPASGHSHHSLMGMIKAEMTFASCVARVISDMDPDEDVEEEYKAKHDNVFSWRTLRLVSQRELRVFQQIYDGDIEKVAGQLKSVKHPGSGIDDAPVKRPGSVIDGGPVKHPGSAGDDCCERYPEEVIELGSVKIISEPFN
jgi:hypothetical protein